MQGFLTVQRAAFLPARALKISLETPDPKAAGEGTLDPRASAPGGTAWLGGKIMAPRRNEALFLVDSWIEEALASHDAVSDAKVLDKRPARDSYAYDRPLLSAAMSVPPRAALMSDLSELCPLLEGDELEPAQFFD